MGQAFDQNKGVVPMNAEVIIRHLSANRFAIEGHWIDTKSIAHIEIEVKPEARTLLKEIFDTIEMARRAGGE